MIDSVGSVCIFVQDQDRAKAFYTQALGFEVRGDDPLYPGASARWLAVAPPGASTEVVLYLMDDAWAHYRSVMGQTQAITFRVRDMMALAADLEAKGVPFLQEPTREPWGTYAIIQDSEGNRLLLVEPAGPGS